jgi:hypothetical protein
MQHCLAVVEGREKAPELLGDLYTPLADADLAGLLESLPSTKCCEPHDSQAAGSVVAALDQ